MSIAKAQRLHHSGSDARLLWGPDATPAGSGYTERLGQLHEWQADHEHDVRLWKFIQTVIDEVEGSEDHDAQPLRDALELPELPVGDMTEMAMAAETNPGKLSTFEFDGVDAIDEDAGEGLESQVRDFVSGNEFLDFHRRMHHKKANVEQTGREVVSTMVPDVLLEETLPEPDEVSMTTFQKQFEQYGYRGQLRFAEQLTRGLSESEAGMRFLGLIVHPAYLDYEFFHALPLLAPQLYQNQETIVATDDADDVIDTSDEYVVITDPEIQDLHENLLFNLLPGLIGLAEDDVLPNFQDEWENGGETPTMNAILEEMFACYEYAVDPSMFSDVEMSDINEEEKMADFLLGSDDEDGFFQPLLDEIDDLDAEMESFDDMRGFTVDGTSFYEDETVDQLEQNALSVEDLFSPMMRTAKAGADFSLATIFTTLGKLQQQQAASNAVLRSATNGYSMMAAVATKSKLLFLFESAVRVATITRQALDLFVNGSVASTIAIGNRLLGLTAQTGNLFVASSKSVDIHRWMAGNMSGTPPTIEPGGSWWESGYNSPHQGARRVLAYNVTNVLSFAVDLVEAAINIHHGVVYGDTRVLVASSIGGIMVGIATFASIGFVPGLIVGLIGGILIALSSIWKNPPQIEKLVDWLEHTMFGPTPPEEHDEELIADYFGFGGMKTGTIESIVPTIRGETPGANRQMARGYQLVQGLELDLEFAKLIAPSPTGSDSDRTTGASIWFKFDAENVTTGSTFIFRIVHDGLKTGHFTIDPADEPGLDSRVASHLVSEPPQYALGPAPRPEDRPDSSMMTLQTEEMTRLDRTIHSNTFSHWTDDGTVDAENPSQLTVVGNLYVDMSDRGSLRTGSLSGFDFDELDQSIQDGTITPPYANNQSSSAMGPYRTHHNAYWGFHEDAGTSPRDVEMETLYEPKHDGTQALFGIPFSADDYRPGPLHWTDEEHSRVWLEVMHVTPEAGEDMGWIVEDANDLRVPRTGTAHEEVPFPRAVCEVELVSEDDELFDVSEAEQGETFTSRAEIEDDLEGLSVPEWYDQNIV
ncbi:hypothetical protein AB7C87_10455 [Natrarchaeobius sp. A-rgal3]|uniref:hypothetical protein n=1 Tax=Natrarchaeobius versutus TaxID=1679078 RepID=UPI00350F9A80